MTNVKQDVISLINSMPEESDYSDIMYEIYFKQKVQQGLNDVEKGNIISHDEVKERLTKWIK